jgi:hypothetical protein
MYLYQLLVRLAAVRLHGGAKYETISTFFIENYAKINYNSLAIESSENGKAL